MESLPDELFLLIFRYLKKFDVICAFNNLNYRFQRIINSYLTHIDVTRVDDVNCKTLRSFYNHVLPSHGHQIQSITFNFERQRQYFEPYIHRFLNLKSLKLKSDKSRQSYCASQLNQFLVKVLSLENLTDLSLQPRKATLKVIANHASKNLSTLSLLLISYCFTLSTMPQIPSIKRLSIESHLFCLKDIFRIMPNLIELNFTLNYDYSCTFDTRANDDLQVPSSLEKMIFKFGTLNNDTCRRHYGRNVSEFENFLNLFKDNLKSLILIGVCTGTESVDHEKMQSLIANFSRLETFQYYLYSSDQPDHCLSNMATLDHRYGHFRQRFQLTLSRYLTPQKLFLCTKFNVLEKEFISHRLLSYYSLNNDLKLRNMREIHCYHHIHDVSSETNRFISKLLTLSPNLQIISFHGRYDIRIVIKWLKELHFNQYRTIDTFTCITETSSDDYLDVIYIRELAEIFPLLKTITLPWLTQYLEENSTALSDLIRHLRENFVHLTHLKLKTSRVCSNAQLRCPNRMKKLHKLAEENLIYYTIDKSNNQHLLNILL
ncbi:unnamed protein product [Adineta ricciae]|uniref:F-box domain-containing protein n=1 Tax=Adineta ricciae TaxID=249248 RepID=A0A814MNQ7_ADIRI|nr:unnamed protein product [Adineta ricciae]CAF1456084.1 unnamed protein product [Adineta ricciae]